MKPSLSGDRTIGGAHDTDIAVIGASCRIPSASSPAEFWRLLSEGTDAVAPWPAERGPGERSWQGGFLDEVGDFDAGFFGVEPDEAAAMDPQQRLALELVWEAMEDAGLRDELLRDSHTGVFVGVSSDDYAALAARGDRAGGGGGEAHDFTGRHRAIIANRVSWSLGLRGPSLAVDAAQASSLVAVHLACESIRRGESDLAFAGGVNLILSPESMRATAGLGALSVKGRCAVFDESADGFVRAEGGGVVLLKPLARAVADGDPVYCVIRGSAVNHDGGGDRLTDPDVAGQRDVLRRAYADARVGPETVQYVELHGTGTPVGDPVEAAAVSAVVGRTAEDRPPLRVGSAKTNVGHLEAAAGIVGLLKAALSLRHRRLPPNLHFRTPNPAIPLAELNLRVQTEFGDWPAPDAPLVAGVSSFGVGGTNCHVVLAEGPYSGRPDSPVSRPATGRPLPWVLSARTGGALDAQAARLLAHLEERPDADAADLARSLAVGRSVFEHRAVVVGADRAELTAGLASLHERAVGGVAADTGRTAFLFAGGGAHRVGMGRELYPAYPVFAAALDEVLDHFDPGLRLRELLIGESESESEGGGGGTSGSEGAGALDGMDRMQPALFAFQVALYRLVTSWGVVPDLLVGHSFGEIVAAHVSGSLPLADAAALAAARGELMEALPPGGAMVAVEASEEEALAALEADADADDVSIGVINGPRSVVVSGAEKAVDRITDAFRAQGRRTTRLRVRQAAHSPLTAPMLDEFARRIRGLDAAEPGVPIVSTVTGRTGAAMTEEYWTGHIGATVRFHDAIETCREHGVTRFLELGPDSVLTPLVQTSGPDLAVALQHRDQPEPRALLTGLAEAWTAGVRVDWAETIGEARTVDLPTYAFQRERHWLDERPAAPSAERHLSSATLALRERVRTEPDGFLDRWLAGHLAETATADTATAAGAAADPDATFRDLGFDSVLSVRLRNRLVSATGLRLPTSVLFDHPTPTALAAHLRDQILGVPDPTDTAAALPAAAAAADDDDPIVIVGMACRLPGGIDSPRELWEAVVDGVDATSEFPSDRGWDLANLYDPDPNHPGTTYARRGGFLAGAGDFDAEFFGISPREAAAMDPQQRLLLETAWEAFERAGISPDGLRGSRTGVFVGAMNMEYGPSLHAPVDGTEGFRLTGSTTSVASGRISYLLGLEGPAMTVDTACSSSLVALHLAVQALRNGECALALAGGVTVLSTPGMFVEFSRQRGLAPDGRCKPFSDDADGTGWSEGVGLLVVERLSDAVRQGHRVLAVVRGSAVNQDGGSNGLTAPNGPSQQRVIRDALASARLGAADVDVVEAHGTGTSLGDPIEAQALLATYGQGRSEDRPLWLGSLKSNIGHTQAAAGVAGVIKMVQAMRHGVMPRSLNVSAPSHQIDWESGAVSLLTSQGEWPELDRPRRSAVSSFGISGTNAHVILESAPVSGPESGSVPGSVPESGSGSGSGSVGSGVVPWVLSGRSGVALGEQAGRLLAHVAGGGVGVRDVGWSLVSGRAVLEHRAVVVGRGVGELVSGVGGLVEGRVGSGVVVGSGAVAASGAGVVLVFPGQGSQWLGMARELLEFSSVFAGRMAECGAALEPFVEGWSLLDVVRSGDEGVLGRVDVVQPVLWAVMVSLAEVWGSLGVRVGAVVGHSQGEIAAACVAGGLSLVDGARVVALRSRAVVGLSGCGGMVSVLASVERVSGWLSGGLSVAVVNGPEQVVVSGSVGELDVLVERCGVEGVQVRRIAVDYASHSPQVEELREGLLEALSGVRPRSGRIPLFSTVSGGLIDTAVMDGEYWFTNLRETVRFDTAVASLLEAGHRIFVEASPHPVLLGALTQNADHAGISGVTAVGTLRRGEDEPERLLRSAAELFVAGVDVDWSPWLAGGRPVELPTYAFQRRRHWLPAGRSSVDAAGLGLKPADHPLLGAAVRLASQDGLVLTGLLSPHTQPWLTDHAVFGTPLLPGTAFVELALHAGGEVGCGVVEELTLERPLVLAEGVSVAVQVSVGAPDGSGRRSFAVHSRVQDADADGEWVRHGVGVLAVGSGVSVERLEGVWPPAGGVRVDGSEVYEALSALGYGYGPVFQGLRGVWRVGGEVFAEVRLPVEADGFGVHPALLDAALHPLPSGDLWVPFSWGGVRLHAVGASVLRVRLSPGVDGVVRLAAFDTAGMPVVTVDELRLQRMSREQLGSAVGDPLFEVRWTEIPVPAVVNGLPAEVVVEVVEPGGEVQAVVSGVLETVQRFLADSADDEDTRLAVVTRGDMRETPDPTTAAVWGLLRSAQAEHPGRIVLVDAVGHDEPRQAVALALASGESQVAVVGGRLSAPRLVTVPAAPAIPAVPAAEGSDGDRPVSGPGRPVFGSGGTVLVTGAGGVLGGLVARHLVAEYGVRHLLLVGRGGGGGAGGLVADLEAAGASVVFAACDVADREGLRAVLAGVGAEHPLTGVVHAAGVLDDGVVSALTPDRVAAVMRPKVEGARLLDELTRGLDLSVFVVFSSAAGVVGTAGQANYAAANAWLDALMVSRRAEGLAGISMAWGLWAGASAMTAHLDAGDLARLSRSGLAPMSGEQGLALFDAALVSGRGAVVPARLDLAALRTRAVRGSLPSVFASLVRAPARRAAAATGADEGSSWLADMSALDDAERELALLDLVSTQISLVLGLGSAGSVEPDRAFRDMGFDSLTGLELRQRLQTETGLRLPSTLVFDYPNRTALVGFLDEQIHGKTATGPTNPMPAALAAVDDDPIVIVGMACRLPGGIDSPRELWEAVVDGVDATSEFPSDRGWDIDGLYDPDPTHLGTSYSRRGGFLAGAGDFDAEFFGISPREAAAMDPQQRLLLETAWEAFERAGIDPTSLRGSRTGVFAGLMYHDYGSWLSEATEDVEGLMITGNSGGVASGRISYLLGLEGPAMTVDTACSSSLVSLHLAVQALRNGECSLALAGGVTVMSTPTTFVEFSRQRAMAPDGRCKAFSDDADGAGWSEGVGLLVVERLSDAVRQGHRVLAVVRGSAVNQDGGSNGLTAPNGPSQQRVIRDALASARLGAADVDVVEAHGTGTSLGDPIEAQALLATYGQGRSEERPLWLGSLKSNIGHTQAAAGVAGVIKMVQAMRHGVMPRTLHADEPSRHVDWESGTVSLLTSQREWPELDRPRRSAVSSFGISGTNAHVILESAPSGPAAPSVPEDLSPADGAVSLPEVSDVGASGSVVPWVLSGRSGVALGEQAGRLLAHVAGGGVGVRDVGWSLVSGRAVLEHRAVVVGRGVGELVSGLGGLVEGRVGSGVVVGSGAVSGSASGVVLVFPGQGSQWLGMARELLEFSSVFAGRMAECGAALEPFVEGWSLLDVVRSGDEGVLGRVDVVQPVLWAVMVSLAEVWGSLGVRVGAVVGHSQGEIAAACVAGGLSLVDGARVVALRSRAVVGLSGCGGMVSVLASVERVSGWLSGGLSVAVVNGPEQVVVSGSVGELDVLVERCGVEGVQVRRIAVDYASHSPQVEELREGLLEALSEVRPRSGRIPLFSTVSGGLIDTAVMDAEYWFTNLRETVRFDTAVASLLEAGHRIFVEASPHPVLVGAVTQAAEGLGTTGVTAVGTLRRGEDEPERLLRSAAELFVAGVDVDWSPWLAGGRSVELPTYAFQRRRHWLPAGRSSVDAAGLGLKPAGHPLLGAAVRLASQDGLVLTGLLSPHTQPWLTDHAVFGTPLLPGTAFVELALRAADEVGCGVVEELTLERPLVLAEGVSVAVQVSVGAPDGSGRRSFAVHSRVQDADTDADMGGDWVRHGVGVLAVGSGVSVERLEGVWPPAGGVRVDGSEVYEALSALGYGYGPVFQGLRGVWRVGGEVFAEVRLPVEADGFGVHPALLDAALHPLPSGDLWVPFSWGGVRLHAVGASVLRVRLSPGVDGVVRLAAFDTAGMPVVTVDELRLQRMSREQLGSAVGDPLFEVRWTEVPVPAVVNGLPAEVVVEVVEPGGEVQAVVSGVLETVQRFLADFADDEDTRLAVVTRGTLTEQPDPVTAAVWGLLRSAQTEHPGRVLMVDVPTGDDARSAVALALASGESQVAVVGGRLSAPRLVTVPAAPAIPAVPAAEGSDGDRPVSGPGRPVFGSGGTVLVTGAGGVLGGLVARHLVAEYGVRHLLLVGRGGGGGAGGLVADLEAAGASVVFAACDVADREGLRAVLAGVGAEHPLTGVVHAAGVLDDGVVSALTPDRVAAVMRPKVEGARLLDELTRGLDLSVFVVFSSAAGVVGTAGQANYAAANAWLDALMVSRRAEGLAGISMAWGLWAGASAMTAHLDAGDLARLSRSGLAPMSGEQGLALFDAALVSGRGAVVPARLDLAALRTRAVRGSLPSVFASLVRAPARRAVAATGADEGSSWLADMSALDDAERETALLQLVGTQISLVLGLGPAGSVEPDRAFRDMGFDSLTGLELRQRLQTETGLRLPSTLVFDYPNRTALVGFLDEQIHGSTAAGPPGASAITAPTDDDPIVIVGMACRYPGGIDSPQRLWDAVVDGLDAVSGFPTDRGWDIDGLYDPDPGRVGTTYTRQGGFLHDAAVFDPEFFGISPREAAAMDPQQRLLLETAWEAFERAGIDPSSLRGSRTGVFAGLMAMEYGPPLHESIESMDGFRMLGSSSSVASGRISYLLGLEGPAMTVDTACSSSLVSLHLAVQALRNGECSLALAGGVTVMSTPTTFVEFSRQRAMAPDGRCKAFSDDADGAGWSEGVGLLVVERLSDAARQGHRVLAVVRGSAVNQDGGSNGLTAPNGPSQQRVIRDALASARLGAADVDVVEAHGTGTSLGDPIEAQALLATYGQGRSEERPLWLGSLKSNIGHTQAAAGVAGVIKMVQAMRHGVMPRTLHADEPSRHVDWESGTVSLLTSQREWPELDRPRRSAVSSFGISGTNAHVILEAAPHDPAAPDPAPEAPMVPWVLSARTPAGVRRQAARLLDSVTGASGPGVQDIGHTLATGRALMEHRAVVLGSGRDELTAALAALARGEETPAAVVGAARAVGAGGLALVFSGQGAQRAGMGRELYERYPVFAEAFDAVCDAVDGHLEGHAEHPLRDVVFAPAGSPAAALLDQSMYTQTGLFALEVALLALLDAWGVTPDYVMGHSLGEITAAYAAGVLSPADACALVAARGRLMQALPSGGAMAALAVDEAEAEGYIEQASLKDAVGIAAVNGPEAVVVSGDEAAVIAVAEHFRSLGRRVRRLSVSHAFHSHRVDAMLDEFADVVAGLSFREPVIPVVSNVTGGLIEPERLCTPRYWVEHVRRSVRFADGVRCLADLGVTAYLEVGPEAAVTPMVHATLDAVLGDDGFVAEAALRSGAPEALALARALARPFVAGAPMAWERLLTGGRRVELPGYPFAGQRYWQDAAESTAGVRAAGLNATRHPLLGAAVFLADGQAVLTGRVLPGSHPWLADHTVGGTPLLPGTAFLELALYAGDAVDCPLVEELTLRTPLVLPGDSAVYLQVVVGAPDEEGRRSVAVHSSSTPTAGAEPPVEHATGVLSPASPPPAAAWTWPPADALPVPVDGLYGELAERGYGYGPAFQGLRTAWRTADALYAEVELPVQSGEFGIHPALLDAALHAVTLGVPSPVGAVARTDGARPLLPFSWTGVTLEASGAATVRVRLTDAGDGGVSLAAVDTAGRTVITVDALALRPMSATARPDRDGGLHLRWRAVPAAEPARERGPETAVAHIEPGDLHTRLAETLERVRRFLADPANAEARLAVVTRGTLMERPDPVAAAVWGLLRSAQAEHPGRLLLADVDERSDAALAAAVASGEPQVAVRAGQVFVPRLSRSAPAVLALPDAREWRLETTGDGDPADSLVLAAVPEPAADPLGPEEVRVSIRAAGICPADLTEGPGAPGTEGAGVVTDIGAGVDGVAVGDRVLGLFPYGGALGTTAVTGHRSLLRVPKGWSFAEAAAAPRAFVTAWHALVDKAGLRSGERVLIRTGSDDSDSSDSSDGFGAAAARIGRHLGAEVFIAPDPGSPDAPREPGPDGARLAEPATGAAAGETPADFDIVLDLTAIADAAPLADGGRQVTAGAAGRPGGATWDLGDVPEARRQTILAELAGLLATGSPRPLPVRAYDVRSAADAYRRLGEDGHPGTAVLTIPRPLDPDGTVVVTGASGALGQLVLRRLVAEHGVRNVLLLSRRGGAAPQDLLDSGVRVDSVACDAADRDQLERALARIPAERPPTAVVHTAGVLDDGVIEALTPDRLATVLRPKADAARALHELTADADLAAFVVFSSAAGVLGSPGQANYAAANAYLDAFAARRHAAGRPAVSIAWGLWTESSAMTDGLGAADRSRIARTGLLPTAADEGLAAFDRALTGALPVVVPVRVDPAALHADTAPPVLRELLPAANRRTAEHAGAAPAESLESVLRGLPDEQRHEILLDLVRTEIALVLGHSDPRGVPADGAFRDLGFDSLTAVELRNRINKRTGLRLGATAVFDHPSPRDLAAHLLDGLVPAPADARDTGEPTYERVMSYLTSIRNNLAVLELTGAQRAALAETVRDMSGPWTDGAETGTGAGEPAPAGLASATATEVLDFVTNSLGISISGDESPTDPS